MEDPAQAAEPDLEPGRALYRAGRSQDVLDWVQAMLADHPESYGLLNLRGAALRSLKQPEAAIEALRRAIVLAPGEVGARMNLGAAMLDLRRLEEAQAAFEGATEAQPDYAEGWRQVAGLRQMRGDIGGAEAALNAGLNANPDHPRLTEGLVLLLRTTGQAGRAEAYLASLLPRLDAEAWIHFHLGDLISTRDRQTGNAHLRRAVALEPSVNHRILLIQSLGRTFGEDEAACLDEAYALATDVSVENLNARQSRIVAEVLTRTCGFADMERLGDFRALGRAWAQAGAHTALLWQMPRVRSDADRLELIAQHQIWGHAVEAAARAQPIVRPVRRTRRDRIRLGIMSSDLRRHPVGYFALPMFDHWDRERFELYAYSWHRGSEDLMQGHFAASTTAFRWAPQATSREAAQLIANDDLDVLIELGGSTEGNRLDVMAWRPAPLQASWLGYPHSTGLAAIDRFVCDPFTAPADPRLLAETPLILPKSFIALGEAVFEAHPPVQETPPSDAAGFVTFGTANSPHKYTREGLAAWARIVAAVPDSRFAFVRPEGGTQAFRDHVLAVFASEGVSRERVLFHPVRGAHMPFYGQIDITLDTFPLTGGTTTVEALWMGAPVVSLKGPAPFERLSWSILANVGLPDLVADDVAGFERIAAALAADRDRRAELRRTLRQRVRQSPLGDARGFAADAYGAIEAVVRA